MRDAGLIFLILVGVTAIHLSGMAICGRLLGLPPVLVRLGFGPVILRHKVRGLGLELGALPLGGFVKWIEGDGIDPFTVAHPGKYAAVSAAGCLLLVAVGFAAGAPLDSFVRGFEQVVLGALRPSAVGAPLLAMLIERVRAEPASAAAVLSMKVAAFNLLPVPSLNGFAVLYGLVQTVRGAKIREPRGAWMIAGVVALLAMGCAWAAAVVIAIR